MAPKSAKRRIVVDGSNIATEGRSTPSLAQLDEAIRTFLDEHPGFGPSDVTVVVDATFGHRIDHSERAAFEQALDHGEMITPPAGAIGRGDGFILRIAEKSGALVLSNDSFQEFHAERPWLFEPGRLIGGKPVPGVGWVFTPRTPVRGPRSRAASTRARRDATEAPSPAKVAATSRQPAPAKGSKAVKVAKVTKVTRIAKPAKATKPAKAARAEPASHAAKAVKPAKAGGAAKTKAPGPTSGSAKAVEATKATKAKKATKASKAVKAVVKAVKAAVKPTKATKPAKAAKPAQVGKAVPVTKAVPLTKVAKGAKGSGERRAASADGAQPAGRSRAKAGTPSKSAAAGRNEAGSKTGSKSKATGTSAAASKAEKTKPAKGARAAKTPAASKSRAASKTAATRADGNTRGAGAARHEAASDGATAASSTALNDPVAFLNFVAEHPIGSTFEGTVASFTSHGAHIAVGEMLCHIPLRGLARPAPTRARQVLTKGETRRFVLVSLDAAHRRAELALPGVGR